MSNYGTDAQSNENTLNEVTSLNDRGPSASITAANAQRLGAIYKQAPWMNAGASLALAKGNASSAAVDAMSNAAATVSYANAPDKAKQAPWYARALNFGLNKLGYVDKALRLAGIDAPVKAGLRWTDAAIQTVPALINNVASDYLDKDSSVEGWWASTPLGTMMDKGDLAGDGYMMNKKVKEIQGERARKYRGEINGHAFTIGRGAANLIVTPGTKPYNFLSGIIDATISIVTDPISKVGKAVKEVRIATNIVPDTAELAQKGVIRGLLSESGLGENGRLTFNESSFGKLMNGRQGKRVVETFVKEKDPLRILEKTKGKLSLKDATRLANSDTSDNVLGIIAEKAVRLSDELDQGVMFPESLKYIKSPGLISRMAPEGLQVYAERLPLARSWRMKWLAEKADLSVAFNGSAEDKTQAYLNYANYLKRNGRDPYLSGTDDAAKTLMKQTMDTLSDPVEFIDENGRKVRSARPGRTDAYKLRQLNFAVKGVQGAKSDGLFAMMLRDIGVSQEQITAAIKVGAQSIDDTIEKMRAYNIDEFGDAYDGGTMTLLHEMGLMPKSVFDALDVIPGEARLVSPGSMVEMLDRTMVLPDPKVFDELRKMYTNPFRVPMTDVSKAGVVLTAEQLSARPITDVLDLIQGSFWKPAALATGGYIVRNSLDAQLRIAMAGLNGMFSHPMDFIRLLKNNSQIGTFNEGKAFIFQTDDVGDFATFTNDLSDYARLGSTGAHHQVDKAETVRKLIKNGEVVIADRTLDAANHTTGIVENVRRLFNDPFFKLYTEHMYESQARRVEIFSKYISKSPLYEQQLRAFFRNGIKVAKPDGTISLHYIPDIDTISQDDLARIWENLSGAKVNTIVGKGGEMNPLRAVAQFNAVPIGDTFPIVKGDSLWDEAMQARDSNLNVFQVVSEDVNKAGKTILKERRYGIHSSDPNPFKGTIKESRNRMQFHIVELGEFGATADRAGSAAFRNLIDDLAQKQLYNAEGAFDGFEFLPKKVAVSQTVLSAEKENLWNKGVRQFFSELYGKGVVLKLEKSPVFRQYYYKALADNFNLLSQEEAQKLLDNVSEYAAQAAKERAGTRIGGLDVRKWDDLTNREHMIQYVGDEDIIKNLETVAATEFNRAKGTVEQMQTYASAYALRRTEDLLFNATKKNNLQEAFRIISPFNAAWEEVLSSYGKFIIEDPTRVLRAQKAFTAGTNFTVVEGGDGFFHQDPVTKEYKFNFPLSSNLIGFLTGGIRGGIEGSGVSLSAPIKGLSIGLGVSPGVGPLVQIAASNLLPDTPDADFARKFLLPYGGTGDNVKDNLGAFVPGWVKKFVAAIDADTGDMSGIFGQTYGDTLRSLAASGKYNPADPTSRQDLFDDAKSLARVVTLVRAVSQLTGPAAAAAEYKISTKKGVVYSGFLIKEFNKFKQENYDTAVSKFIDLYGENVMAYTSSKTRTTVGGLETSSEFGDFERENKGLFETHPDVAGFLGPFVEGYDQTTFSRQKDSGKRVALSGEEIIASAELRVGSSLYRAARLKAGQYPSRNQLEWLAGYRERLHAQYNGFPVKASFDPGKLANTMQQLQELVSDPRAQGNANASSIAQYLNYREEALARMREAGYSSLDSKAAQPLRDWLASMAEDLYRQNPGFQRVYDRELAVEVEQ